jgi:L-rhamnose isomerase/sugar isomerase
MIDQSHNMKGKLEAMVQSVVTAQEIFAKASLVDRDRLAELQNSCSLVEAEECFRDAFWQDVRPLVRAWRESRNLPCEPLKALAESGYVEKISREREHKNRGAIASYA